MTLFIKRIS